MASGTYNADSITVLEGLEAVRRRPGMYIGGVDKAGLHHLLWEIVDNSVDEVMNGHASRIVVTLEADGKTMSVVRQRPRHPRRHPPQDRQERARGDLHHAPRRRQVRQRRLQGRRRPARRRRQRRQRALSKSLVAAGPPRRHDLHPDATAGASRSGPVERGEPARGTGTTVTFTPDPEIFRDIHYDPKVIAERLEVKTYLNKGLVIQFVDQKSNDDRSSSATTAASPTSSTPSTRRGSDTRVAALPFVLEREDADADLRCHLALAWTEATDEDVRSFVNTIPTRDGGTHEQGMREAVRAAVLNGS